MKKKKIIKIQNQALYKKEYLINLLNEILKFNDDEKIIDSYYLREKMFSEDAEKINK